MSIMDLMSDPDAIEKFSDPFRSDLDNCRLLLGWLWLEVRRWLRLRKEGRRILWHG